MEQIEEKIRDFISTELLWDKNEELDGQTLLIENGVIDSIGIIRLISFMEEVFDIRIPDDELVPENFETVSRIGQFVNERMNHRGSQA